NGESTGGNGGNSNNTNNDNASNDQNDNNTETTDEPKKKEDVITVITKDIPLSKTENGVTDELIKSYITATSKEFGKKDFVITGHNVKAKSGIYEVTIRFDDGSEQTVSINVIDDSMRDVQQPEFGKDDECMIHWIMLLILLGYGIYAITMILKRRRDTKVLDEAISDYESKKEGGLE
ncbi:MAG: hypothetical protein RR531_04700, partial [Longicatena sp.]